MIHPQPCRKGTNLSSINVWFAESTFEKNQPTLLFYPLKRLFFYLKSHEGLSPVQPSRGESHTKVSLLLHFGFRKILSGFQVTIYFPVIIACILVYLLFILNI